MKLIHASLVLLVLLVLIISPFPVSAEQNAINDELKVMGDRGVSNTYISQAEEIIRELEIETRSSVEADDGVKIRVEISDHKYEAASLDEFYNEIAQDMIYKVDYSLDERGNPVYNMFIIYAKVATPENSEGVRVLHVVHSDECLDLAYFNFGEMRREMEPVLNQMSGKDFFKLIKYTAAFIEESIGKYGMDCSEEMKEDETQLKISKNVYLIDDTDWKNVLSLIPLTTYHHVPDEKGVPLLDQIARRNNIMYSPTLVYHREGEDVDVDSILIFLEQFDPDMVTIFYDGEFPEKLKKLTNSENDWKWETATIPVEQYQFAWNMVNVLTRKYDSIILSEDDYKTGLMASLFASYMNAPLVFSPDELNNYDYEITEEEYIDRGSGPSAAYEADHGVREMEDEDDYLLKAETIRTANKKIYCIGKVEYSKCDEKYTLERLQEVFRAMTLTDKILLVNPNDIYDENCESFEYTRDFGKLTKSHCKDSLLAPILASVKNELIVFTDIEPLTEGVKLAEPQKSTSFYVDGDENFYLLQYGILEKVDFDKKTKTSIETNSLKFPLNPVLSSEEKMYYMDKDGFLAKLDGDELVRLMKHESVYDKIRDYFEESSSGDADLVDYVVDDKENLYVMYSTEDTELALVKWSSEGNKVFRNIVKIPENRLPEEYSSAPKTKLKVTPDGVHVVISFFLERVLQPEILTRVVYHKYDPSDGSLKEEREHLVTMEEHWYDEKFYIDYAHDIYIDDDLVLYFYNPYSPNLIVLKLGGDDQKFFDRNPLTLPPIKNMFVNNGKIYVLFSSGSVGVFGKTSSDSVIDTKFRLLNGRHECFFYSDYSNPVKGKFENELNSKAEEVKEDIDDQSSMLLNNYLTILSSPRAIPMSKYVTCLEIAGSKGMYMDFRNPLDVEYSKNKAVGRIFGITVSDTSGYINRVIAFSKNGYSYVPENGETREFNKVGLLASNFPKYQWYVPKFRELVAKNGYDTSCFVGERELEKKGCEHTITVPDDFLEKNDVILYDDDGNVNYWAYPRISSDDLRKLTLSSPVAFSATCSDMNYYDSGEDDLFGTNFISRGGLGYYGSVSPTLKSYAGAELFTRMLGTYEENEDIITIMKNRMGLEGYDLGNALISSLGDPDVYSIFEEINILEIYRDFNPNYMLLGDPTVQLALPKKVDLGDSKYEKTKITEKLYCLGSACPEPAAEGTAKRKTVKADVKICMDKESGGKPMIKAGAEVTIKDYGDDNKEFEMKNPLRWIYDDIRKMREKILKEKGQAAASKWAGAAREWVDGYTTSPTITLNDEVYPPEGYKYEYEYRFFAASDFCKCYRNQEKCFNDNLGRVSAMSGFTPSTEDPGSGGGEETVEKKKENVFICTAVFDYLDELKGDCTCIPCGDYSVGKTISWDHVECDGKVYRRYKNTGIYQHGSLLMKRAINKEFVCITECSGGKCGSNIEHDAATILKKLGNK